LRGKIVVSADTDEETIKTCALEDANVKSFIEGKNIQRIIIVPKRLINIVVA